MDDLRLPSFLERSSRVLVAGAGGGFDVYAGTKSGGTANFALGGTYGLIDPISDGFFGTMGPGQEAGGERCRWQ